MNFQPKYCLKLQSMFWQLDNYVSDKADVYA